MLAVGLVEKTKKEKNRVEFQDEVKPSRADGADKMCYFLY